MRTIGFIVRSTLTLCQSSVSTVASSAPRANFRRRRLEGQDACFGG